MVPVAFTVALPCVSAVTVMMLENDGVDAEAVHTTVDVPPTSRVTEATLFPVAHLSCVVLPPVTVTVYVLFAGMPDVAPVTQCSAVPLDFLHTMLLTVAVLPLANVCVSCPGTVLFTVVPKVSVMVLLATLAAVTEVHVC